MTEAYFRISNHDAIETWSNRQKELRSKNVKTTLICRYVQFENKHLEKFSFDSVFKLKVGFVSFEVKGAEMFFDLILNAIMLKKLELADCSVQQMKLYKLFDPRYIASTTLSSLELNFVILGKKTIPLLIRALSFNKSLSSLKICSEGELEMNLTALFLRENNLEKLLLEGYDFLEAELVAIFKGAQRGCFKKLSHFAFSPFQDENFKWSWWRLGAMVAAMDTPSFITAEPFWRTTSNQRKVRTEACFLSNVAGSNFKI